MYKIAKRFSIAREELRYGAVRTALRAVFFIPKEYNRTCIICGETHTAFFPSGSKSSLYRKHTILGGGYKKNNVCIYCGSHLRDRWQYYVLKELTDITSAPNIKVLHFAAEPQNTSLIRENTSCDYIRADIKAGRGDMIIDITNIEPFPENTFDYIIANHVLEHIVDEHKALSELHRVLKDSGKLIISFPICMEIKTYEDSNIVSPVARLNAYGQVDHVRLYGNDYRERIESAGFSVNSISPYMYFDQKDISKYGLEANDVIMICTKNG